MTCEMCGKGIEGFYARFKRFGSNEYMSFHAENGSGRIGSCWDIWVERKLRPPKHLESPRALTGRLS
jgi:hypothetical protein